MDEETYAYGNLVFEWDRVKAEENAREHGVTFEQAASTWGDNHAISRGDDAHSWNEDRTLRLALATTSDLLLVVHCFRKESGRIRIISARKATKHEEALYAELRGMA